MPTIAELFSQAVTYHQAARLQEADDLYRQILAQDPSHEAALVMLGVLAHQVGRSDVALRLLARATEINPENPDAHNNLGVVHAAGGAIDQAITCYQKALALRPDNAQTLNNLGTAFRDAGRLADAIASYSRATAIAPGSPGFHDNLGLAHQQAGDPSQAIASFERAAGIAPEIADFRAHLASALRELGRLDESVAAARKALAVEPNSVSALSTLGSTLKDCGRLDEALDCYRQAASLPGGERATDAFLFAIHLHPDYTPERIADEHRRWGTRFPAPAGRHTGDKSPTRPLRIGYVSPDFRHHVVGHNILPLFENRDREKFQIFCYSNTPRPDGLTARFRSLSAGWRDIGPLSDDRAAELIVSEKIDILVDLALHTTGNRLGVLARKPAPVQVTFAGYPGTTGLPSIDYRLTDPYLDPPGGHDGFYTEQSVRLPHSFWCHRPIPHDAPVNPLPALQSGTITFGYLGAFSKINPPTLDLWSRVLAAVPASKLLLMSRPGSSRARTLEHFAARGIDSSRVEFADHQPREQYLRTYHRTDIILDSHPYNGHTTGLDALWMGVPVVSLFGRSAVSRAGLSQLSNLGLAELATDSRERFVEIAAALARDLPRLAELRSTLRQRMRLSPLTDGQAFTRAVETAYRSMWQRFCEQP